MITDYSDPIVTLNQVYKASTVGATPVLGACIIGPNYFMHSVEKEGQALRLDSADNYPSGDYNVVYEPDNGLAVRPYPGLTSADGVIDIVKITPKVIVKEAKLLYMDFAEGDTFQLQADTGYDTIKVTEASKNSPYVFKGISMDETSVEAEAGDPVEVTIDGQVVKCFIQGFLKDTNGRYTRCVLTKALPPESEITDVKLFKVRDVELTEGFTFTDSTIGVDPKVSANVQLKGIAGSYPITEGAFYVEYRSVSTRFIGKYGMLSSVDDVQGVLGVICPQNPLGIAVACALQESNNNFVYFTAVDVDRLQSTEDVVKAYTEAADLVADKDGMYSIVPCTSDKDVNDGLFAFVLNQSSEEIPYFKYLMGSVDIPSECVAYRDAKVSTIQKAANGVSTKITFDSSVLLSIGNVTKGDVIKWNGYQATVVESNNKNSITVQGDITESLKTGDKVDIYFTLKNNAEIITDIIANKKISDKRMSYVFADGAIYKGHRVPNYCVAAALAGRRSAVEPHAPLSNVAMTAITTAEDHGFAASQIKQLGAFGFWRVGTNESGVCISRRQLTSAASGDVNLDQQSIVTNIDSIGLTLKTAGRNMVGNSNISPSVLSLLQVDLSTRLQSFREQKNTFIGPQLLSCAVISVIQDPVNKDRVYAQVEGEPPKPFNRFHITFYMR